MPSVIVPPVRVSFTPVPSYIKIRKRSFQAAAFIGARKDGEYTVIRLRVLNGRFKSGKISAKTGRSWNVLHCQDSPEEIVKRVKGALLLECRDLRTRERELARLLKYMGGEIDG